MTDIFCKFFSKIYINKNIEDFKSEIESEYGSININLQDGSYTEIEKTEKTE